MATVYLAHDLRHGRAVALKVLRPELARVLGRDRFLAEIRLTAQLDHPHILPLLDSGEADGYLWYTLPYVRGESLRARLTRERQLPVADALAITGAIAAALAYAHARGVVHRDVKPENILLHEGEAVLADFGIAVAVREAGGSRLTETGLSLGTPQYMSPEQAAGDRALDGRSDLYSLAAVTYEMLAGEAPHSAPTPQALLAKVMMTVPTPLRVLRPAVAPHVESAVARALAKLPADRFPDARAFLAALAGPETGGERPAVPTPARPRRVVPLAALLGVLVLAALAFGVAMLRRGRGGGEDPALVALYRRGQAAYARRTPTGTLEAIRDFSAVVARDSAFGPAWTGLAEAYQRAHLRQFALPGIPRDSVLQLAVWAVGRALLADSLRADAWVATAQVSRSVDPTDIAPADRAIRRALALDPRLGPAWHLHALNQIEAGQPESALVAWRTSVRVDPGYLEGVAFLGIGHYWRGAFDSSLVWAESAVARDPTYLLGRMTQGFTAVELGQHARAIAAFEAARRLAGDVEIVNATAGIVLALARAGERAEARHRLAEVDSLAVLYQPVSLHTAVWIAEAHAAVGDTAGALDWLRRYHPQRDLHFLLHLRCDAAFRPLAGLPAFRAIVALGPAGC